MQIYHGANGDIYEFEQGDRNYLAQHNVDLRTIIDHDHTNNPIDGGSAIQAATITGDRIVNSTITSDKLAPQLSFSTLANNAYQKWRNNADNADLSAIRVNTSDHLEFNLNIDQFRLGNNKVAQGYTVGGVGVDLFKVNLSDQWEFLNTAYVQNLIFKTDNTYGVGDATHYANRIRTKTLRFSESESDLTAFIDSGTYSWTVYGSSSAGVGTYTARSGYYVKIGNFCFISGRVSWSAHTGTGNVYLALPFAAASFTGFNQSIPITFCQSGASTNTLMYSLEIASTATFAVWNRTDVAGVSGHNISTAGDFAFNGWYRTA